jgi:hypothetical protein
MKILKAFTSLFLIFALIFNMTSCVIVSGGDRHDNGLYKGWYKNSENRHAGKSEGKVISPIPALQNIDRINGMRD